jgi:LPXTG-motif cell wall-anchored protein
VRFENSDPGGKLAKTGFQGGLLIAAGLATVLLGGAVMLASKLELARG